MPRRNVLSFSGTDPALTDLGNRGGGIGKERKEVLWGAGSAQPALN